MVVVALRPEKWPPLVAPATLIRGESLRSAALGTYRRYATLDERAGSVKRLKAAMQPTCRLPIGRDVPVGEEHGVLCPVVVHSVPLEPDCTLRDRSPSERPNEHADARAPWGVPVALCLTLPSSTTPASSHRRSSFSTRRSQIRRPTSSISTVLSIVSRKLWMSPSMTIERPRVVLRHDRGA